jgi:hypothetical protein
MRQIQLTSAHSIATLVVLLCASSRVFAAVSDVVSTGTGTYLVSSQATNGWSTPGAQKTKVFERAHTYCAAKGKEMQTVSSKTSARGLGQIAHAEVEFRCVDAGR